MEKSPVYWLIVNNLSNIGHISITFSGSITIGSGHSAFSFNCNGELEDFIRNNRYTVDNFRIIPNYK